MSLAPRNAPCPCGSGRKYKKCCGADRAHERALEERRDALAAIALRAREEPRMVPLDDGFESWADAVLAGAERDPVDAIRQLPPAERIRLLQAYAEIYADELAALAPRCDESEVREAILAGAIVAGLEDRRVGTLGASREAIDVLEGHDELLADPEAAGWALDGMRLWSAADGVAVDRELTRIPDWLDDEEFDVRADAALAQLAEQLWTDWHERRMERLVDRIAEQLPIGSHPRATEALAESCRLLKADPGLRRRLAARLLMDVVPIPELGFAAPERRAA